MYTLRLSLSMCFINCLYLITLKNTCQYFFMKFIKIFFYGLSVCGLLCWWLSVVALWLSVVCCWCWWCCWLSVALCGSVVLSSGSMDVVAFVARLDALKGRYTACKLSGGSCLSVVLAWLCGGSLCLCGLLCGVAVCRVLSLWSCYAVIISNA